MAGALVLLAALAAAPGMTPGSAAAAIERLRGNYLQQAVELASVDGRLVRLTRMTRFRRCGDRRGLAEEFNEHVVEVLGQQVPGVGFVAGIVNAVEGCETRAAGRLRDLGER